MRIPLIFERPRRFFRKLKALEEQKGQALLEFLLIMAMLYLLALSMLKVTNNSLGKIWEIMVSTIGNYPVQLR